MFFSYNFFHLTGLKIKNTENLNPKKFYNKLLINKIKINDFELKNNTTKWKIDILPQILKIDILANQIGEFINLGNLLKTDILVGTTRNSCLGLKFLEKNQIYIPNTILKEYIRKIIIKRNRVIAILKKDVQKDKYEEITYISNNLDINSFYDYIRRIDKINLEKVLKNNKINLELLNTKNIDKKTEENVK